ncbi:MAG: hypothetical protein IKK66_01630 [Ruminococcus sp.]|nr:hypothetical protein [Ruminococcus sp.]
MTDKEIRKLKRADLLEILYYLQKEIEELNKENESLITQLENAKVSLSENELKRIIKAVKSAARDGAREAVQLNSTDDEQNNISTQQNNEVKQKHGKRNKT